MLGSRVTFKQLFEHHQKVVVPIIQRDYAQGRDSESEVRRDFLDALINALNVPENHPSLPLNLDFIYGSVVENESAEFQPLDGQQRLTTLFLLHWYLAWNDGCMSEFRKLLSLNNGNSRFTYEVRPSSSEFFDELINFHPRLHPKQLSTRLSEYLTDQSWYFRNWRLDPTIQASLNMLDEIHSHTRMTNGLYSRLVDDNFPAITFQLLELKNFGLSDDLYIKMNARGKPLTALETFKARYEQDLKALFEEHETKEIGGENVSIAEYFSRRMDTTWADFFWRHQNQKSDLYDDAAISLFRMVVLLSRDPKSDSYIEDVHSLRNPSIKSTHSSFQALKWIDRQFSELLILLLDTWSDSEDSSNSLPNAWYFDESDAIKVAMKGRLTEFSFEGIVQFVGYTLYLKFHKAKSLDSNAFQAWMRIVVNLTSNYSYNRLDDVRRSVEVLNELVQHSSNILQYFADRSVQISSGFNEKQVDEECLKAQLILTKAKWDSRIYKAENHRYFKGQVEFLFDFCRVLDRWEQDGHSVDSWDQIDHSRFQSGFDDYFAKAKVMFEPTGLKVLGNFEWQRALLTVGNYFLPSGRGNESFLVNTRDNQASWKRFLSGWYPSTRDTRRLLQVLFDSIDIGESKSIREQLKLIIDNASEVKPLWRKLLIETPEAFRYCQKHNIRIISDREIYLVYGIALNGYHAELFTFHYFQKTKSYFDTYDGINPLQINREYKFVSGTHSKPKFELIWSHDDQVVVLSVEWRNSKLNFVVTPTYDEFSVNELTIQNFHLAREVRDFLLTKVGFNEYEDKLIKEVYPDDFFHSIDQISERLRGFAPLSSINFWQPISDG